MTKSAVQPLPTLLEQAKLPRSLQGKGANGNGSQSPFWMLIGWVLITEIFLALAFYPASTEDLAWLARTQFVCFGVESDGFPSTYGWLLLILAPLSLLAGLLTVFRDELSISIEHLTQSRLKKILACAFFSIFAFEGGWVVTRILTLREIQAQKLRLLEPEATYPDLENILSRLQILNLPKSLLTDQSGKRFSRDFFEQNPSIISFVFAHCPSVCPMLIRETTAAQKELSRMGVKLVLVSHPRKTPIF